MRKTICLIAGSKNEAKALPKFFEHHDWVDEILVMDSFSTDDTTAICTKYGRSYCQAEMAGNANVRHNLALQTAKSDWIMLIDPDEFISNDLKKEILAFLESDEETFQAYEIQRVNYFMDKPLLHGGWSGAGIKIFKRDKVAFKGDSYHENPTINGEIGILKGVVDHFPNPSIHWILQKFNYISEFDYKAYFDQYGVLSEKKFRWLLLTRPTRNFWKCYCKKQGFRDGLHGFMYAALIWAFDIIRICKYGERYLVKNSAVLLFDQIPDPWECRKVH